VTAPPPSRAPDGDSSTLTPYQLREDGVYQEFSKLCLDLATRCANIAAVMPNGDDAMWDRAVLAIKQAREASA